MRLSIALGRQLRQHESDLPTDLIIRIGPSTDQMNSGLPEQCLDVCYMLCVQHVLFARLEYLIIFHLTTAASAESAYAYF